MQHNKHIYILSQPAEEKGHQKPLEQWSIAPEKNLDNVKFTAE